MGEKERKSVSSHCPSIGTGSPHTDMGINKKNNNK
jgi:hypothetical protein